MNKPLLQLYITGLTPRSERAIANLRRICEEKLDGRYEMVIIDVLERPQLAEDERYYGFPVFGVPGFKLGRYHHLFERGPADELQREPRPADERVLRDFAARYFPDGAGPALTLKTCLFENSPDEHFILDRLPDAPQVVVGGGFSGHGFKFCSVVGEILADLAVDGDTRHDIAFLGLGRLGREITQG